MKYKVFVDDIRLAPTEYNKVFRDAESFLKWIKENPVLNVLDFLKKQQNNLLKNSILLILS